MRAALTGLLALLLQAPASTAEDDTMTFRVVAARDCRGSCPAEIAADGLIALDSARAFRAAASTLAPNRIVVRLASPGGNLVGGMELGHALRELNATVIVGKGARCVSACVYAFLGGAQRRVAGGRIGIHRFRPGGDESADDFPAVLVQRAIEILTDYVTRMGADPELIRLATSIPPTTVRYLDAGELRRYRVVN